MNDEARRARLTLIAAMRFADTTVRYARSAQRRAQAAARLEQLIDEYVNRYGPVSGPGPWRSAR